MRWPHSAATWRPGPGLIWDELISRVGCHALPCTAWLLVRGVSNISRNTIFGEGILHTSTFSLLETPASTKHHPWLRSYIDCQWKSLWTRRVPILNLNIVKVWLTPLLLHCLCDHNSSAPYGPAPQPPHQHQVITIWYRAQPPATANWYNIIK